MTPWPSYGPQTRLTEEMLLRCLLWPASASSADWVLVLSVHGWRLSFYSAYPRKSSKSYTQPNSHSIEAHNFTKIEGSLVIRTLRILSHLPLTNSAQIDTSVKVELPLCGVLLCESHYLHNSLIALQHWKVMFEIFSLGSLVYPRVAIEMS